MKAYLRTHRRFPTAPCFAMFAACLAAGLAPAHAAPPRLQPLVQPGKWFARPPASRAVNLTIAGNYAYIALEAGGLAVVDVSNPAKCVRVGGFGTSEEAYGVAVSGHYAYVAGGRWTGSNVVGSLQVIDVNDPTNCVRMGGYETSGFASIVAVLGNYAYLAGGGGLHVINVSDPTNCVRVGGCDTGVDWSVRALAVSGNYAYVVGSRWTGSNDVGSLQVIDVSNPTNCVRVGGCDTGVDWSVRALAVSGNYAYVAGSRWTGSNYVGSLQAIDVSHPTNCVRVGGCDTGVDWSVHALAVSGQYAYVAANNDDLQVIDISNPTNCVRVSGCGTSGSNSGVAVSGNYAFVTDYYEGLGVFDVSDPTNCVPAGGWGGSASGVAVSGNYAYVAEGLAGLQVIDVRNPANCVPVGGHATKGVARKVVVSGNYAFVAASDAGLQVIDVRNPANCVPVGGYDTDWVANDVAVSGNYAYVAAFRSTDSGLVGSLQVIDVSDPTNCVPVGGYDTGEYALGVALSGNYAYVADYRAGLQVIDVSDPTNCALVGGWGGPASGVAVSGNYAYVVDRFSLHVIDVSNPANCVRVGGARITGWYASGVAVSGKYAYVTYLNRGDPYYCACPGGLNVFDVSDPTNGVLVGRYDTSGQASDVAVVDGRIYVADGEAGLLVLPRLPNVQFTVRVDEGTLGTPYTIEAATSLTGPNPWTPLWTTNPPALPFDFVDYDVKLSDKPHKFYRVRQP